jgi:hypothetical protein
LTLVVGGWCGFGGVAIIARIVASHLWMVSSSL